jgi:hypothetical protein
MPATPINMAQSYDAGGESASGVDRLPGDRHTTRITSS